MADGDFEKFWAAYPRHETKVRARASFEKLAPDAALLALIIQDAKDRYRGIEVKLIPHPSTYLNQRRWEDEDKPSSLPAVNGGGPYRVIASVNSLGSASKIEESPISEEERTRVKAAFRELIRKLEAKFAMPSAPKPFPGKAQIRRD